MKYLYCNNNSKLVNMCSSVEMKCQLKYFVFNLQNIQIEDFMTLSHPSCYEFLGE